MVLNMKKIFSIGVLSLGAALLLSGTSFADSTWGPTAAGDPVQIDVVDASTPNMTFNPSPGVSMSGVSTDSNYALSASNLSAAIADRNEYGVWSGYGGYYQQETPADQATVIDVSGYDPDAATTPFGDPWLAMGGSGGDAGS